MGASPEIKWRPRLSLVVSAVLVTVAFLPLCVILYLRSSDGYALSTLWPALALIGGVTAIVGYVFVRALTGPVQELTERTAQLASGDRTANAPLSRNGTQEIAELSVGLTRMADALSDRADYISSFATHVSHEIKTPLTSIRGAVELIMDQGDHMSQEDRDRFLENILDDTWRMTVLLDRLRDLARADNATVHGRTSITEVTEAMSERFPSMQIVLSGETDACIAMSEENAAIVFSNLIENASQHGADCVALDVSVPSNGPMHIAVQDNGYGVSKGNETRLFDLFFTTRRDNGGTGMGLGIVRSMLGAHKGTINLIPPSDAKRAQGAHFEIILPQF